MDGVRSPSPCPRSGGQFRPIPRGVATPSGARTIGVIGFIAAVSCGSSTESDGEAKPKAVTEGSGEIHLANEFQFADGATLAAVHIAPGRLRWGARASITWESSVPGPDEGIARVSILPPLALRQEVLYGSSQSTPSSHDDSRQVSVDVAWRVGGANVVLPHGFHPRSLVMTLERFVDGESVPVIRGARTRHGAAVIGVVPVETQPTAVSAARASIRVDGFLDETVWKSPGTALVDSLHGEPVPTPQTRVWFAWNEEALFMAAHVQDPDIGSSFQQRDDPLWKEEAVELFIAADGGSQSYLEFQTNVRGAVFDARFISHRRGEESWNAPVRVAVQVNGSMDDRKDRDEGWTLELAVPWDVICPNTGFSCPPEPNRTLRINAFRLERPRKGETLAMALSPTRVPDFHALHNAAILELSP